MLVLGQRAGLLDADAVADSGGAILIIHLWKENGIDMDWRQPLEAFGGKTAFEVAEDGFRCHISQQVTDYHVEDWGPWDNSLFGLYRTTVGPDDDKDDFFENLN